MSYLIADDYGVIGNHFSAALVNLLGSVDWCCFPYLDSPSHFGAFIDKHQGGNFQISPQGDFHSEQRYTQGTQVLETHFETPTGRAILTDWMPFDEKYSHSPSLCRRIHQAEGKINWLVTCTPRFRYGTDAAQAERHLNGILFRGTQFDDLAILSSEIPLEISSNGASALAHFTLEKEQNTQFVWAWGRLPILFQNVFSKNLSKPELQATVEYWRKFEHHCPRSGCVFGGPWHDEVIRSGLMLKLFTAPYSGSITEAIAVTLKGIAHGSHTWGHRYASIRDGALKLQAFTNLGYIDEAHAYFSWLKAIIERDGAEGLQPLYTLDGGRTLPERELPFYGMHEVSRQFQLDIYGHVIIAVSEYFKIFGSLPNELWNPLSEIADYICQAWKRPDHGPWGLNTKSEHFVVSKVFCWAGLDRMCWLARINGKSPSPRWMGEKTILHNTICGQGFDPVRNTFVRSFGDREIDSSILWIPLLNFLPNDDARIIGTLDVVRSELSQGVLLKRSRIPYDLQNKEKIDFWSSLLFISCLAQTGQVEEASDRLAEICTYSNPLGLFGDQIDLNPEGIPRNFPSSSVHFSLINAALFIGWAKGKHKPFSEANDLTSMQSKKTA